MKEKRSTWISQKLHVNIDKEEEEEERQKEIIEDFNNEADKGEGYEKIKVIKKEKMAETERESVGGRQSGGDGAEYAQTKPLRVRLDVDTCRGNVRR